MTTHASKPSPTVREWKERSQRPQRGARRAAAEHQSREVYCRLTPIAASISQGGAMSVFEYVFSLYSLLLGLALAHLLSALAKVVERRDKVRLGWPTALLALQMMLTLAIFWEIAWRARSAVPDNSAALFVSLIICSLLYFGSVLIIPSNVAPQHDLDEHFFKEKGTVLGCIFLANLVAYGWRYALMGWPSFAYFSWADWA